MNLMIQNLENWLSDLQFDNQKVTFLITGRAQEDTFKRAGSNLQTYEQTSRTKQEEPDILGKEKIQSE